MHISPHRPGALLVIGRPANGGPEGEGRLEAPSSASRTCLSRLSRAVSATYRPSRGCRETKWPPDCANTRSPTTPARRGDPCLLCLDAVQQVVVRGTKRAHSLAFEVGR